MSPDPDAEIFVAVEPVATVAVRVEPPTVNVVGSAIMGPQGPEGPPTGTIVSGHWDYHVATTPPPASGQIRTTPDPIVVGDPMTIYLSATDDTGLYWDAGLVKPGDEIKLRGSFGAVQYCEVTSFELTVPGPGGYATIEAIATSVQGQINKNAVVEASVIKAPLPGPAGPEGPPGPQGIQGPAGPVDYLHGSKLLLPAGAVACNMPKIGQFTSFFVPSGQLWITSIVIPAGKRIRRAIFVNYSTPTPTGLANQWALLANPDTGEILSKSTDRTNEAWAPYTPKTFTGIDYTPAVDEVVHAGLVVVATSMPRIVSAQVGSAMGSTVLLSNVYAAGACNTGLTGPSSLPNITQNATVDYAPFVILAD